MGRERGSSEEQLRGWGRDTEGLSCSEPSAHALLVVPAESDPGGAASLASARFLSKSLYFDSLILD